MDLDGGRRFQKKGKCLLLTRSIKGKLEPHKGKLVGTEEDGFKIKEKVIFLCQ